MTATEKQLVLAAAQLARTAPESWKQFLGAFAAHNELIRNHCIASPLDVLPVAQGRAQTARDLLGLLENCVQSADQIEKRSRT